MTPGPRRMALVAVLILAGVFWVTVVDDSGGEQPDEEVVETQLDEGPALSGRVVDQAGRPVGEAEVVAGDESTETDREGQFRFESLEPGTRLVDVEAADYVRAGVGDGARSVVTVEEGESIEDLEFVLLQPAGLSGRVTAGGEPVEDAEISISYDETTGIEGEKLDPYILSEVAVTDGDGRFSVDEIAPGRLEVMAEAGEGFASSDSFEVAPGSSREDVAIDLAPSGVVEARVVGPAGESVAAELTLRPTYADVASRAFEVGEEGDHVADELEEGLYTVVADADGYRRETIEDVEVRADETTRLEVELEPSRGLVGRVVEPDGTAVADARVTVERGDEVRRTETDDKGRFQWENITSGEWLAVANSEHHDPSAPTPLQPDREVAVELTPGGTILGRVLDDRGHPVDEFTVKTNFLEIHGEDRDHTREQAPEEFEDRRGRFDVGPVPTGRYRLEVLPREGPGSVTEAIEVEAGQTVGPITVELDAGSLIYGTIRDAASGEPIGGARIVHDDAPGGERPVAETDREGYYELEEVAGGVHRLRVEHDDYVTELLDGVEVDEQGELAYDVELVAAGQGRDGFVRYDTGAVFGTDDGEVEVLVIEPDSPAAVSELEVGDVVEAVDGIETDEMVTDEVVQRIRGDRAVPTVLEVRRPGRGPMTIEVDRRRHFTAERQH